MKFKRRRGLLLCSIVTLILNIPIVATVISILAMVMTNAEVTSIAVFTMFSVMYVLGRSVNIVFGLCLLEVSEMIVGLNRMETFLKASVSGKSEGGVDNVGFVPTSGFVRVDSVRPSTPTLLRWRKTEVPRETTLRLSLNNITASWDDEAGRQTLRNITLSLTGNQFIAITGPVGSGKSSLLMAMLGELPIQSGELVCSTEKVAFVSQTPWVFSGTVRENIVFGRPFDEQQYLAALQACDLWKDILLFAKGDSTKLGERGVSLSGGQRARVSLARAVYAQADVYLLDDPLSAVDNKVGRHLYDKCICGVLSNRLRVLTTHQLHYLEKSDHIVVLQNGTVVQNGSYEDLKGSDVMASEQLIIAPEKSVGGARSRLASTLGGPALDVGVGLEEDLAEQTEDRMVGSLTWKVYWNFFREAMSAPLLLAIFLFCVLAQGGSNDVHCIFKNASTFSNVDAIIKFGTKGVATRPRSFRNIIMKAAATFIPKIPKSILMGHSDPVLSPFGESVSFRIGELQLCAVRVL